MLTIIPGVRSTSPPGFGAPTMEYLLLFLAIGGGLCFGFVLIVVAIYVGFRFFLRRAMKEVADVMKDMPLGTTPFVQPLRIKLERVTDAEWTDESAIEDLA